jgi:hypothetical protein
VRVPDDAGTGKAKVVVRFDDWADGKVVPAVFEIPVIDPGPEAKANEKSARDVK